MKFEFLEKNSKNLVVLNKELLKTLEPQENILGFNIKYWLKTGKIISLKKGTYILADVIQRIGNADKYLEYISGQLIQPSYLSVEYVLAKYQILSEPVQAITAVTVKKTQKFSNELGVFRYYSIAEKLFTGYEIKKEGALVFAEANKSKALFDFLYFRFLKDVDVNEVAIDNLRLNWENVNRSEFKKAEAYLKLTKSKRMKEVFKLIRNKFYV
jgi:hypothetical protein